MRRKVIGSLMVIMIILTLTVSILTTVSFSSQQVSISLFPNPKVDIVLAKSKTTTDVTNFETDILNQLQSLGVNTSNVQVTSVESEEIDMQNSFKWQQDLDLSIGDIDITNDGQDVEMVGNRTLAGKNAIWIIPTDTEDIEQEFNFDYDIDYGDSFNAAGMLLRVQQSGNTLTGYMLSFNKSNKEWYTTSGSYGAIWEFTYEIGDNRNNMTKTLLQGINIDQSGNLTVRISDSYIVVSGGGLSSPVEYQFTNSFGNGFGFFADHYSHDCSQIGSFKLSNINLRKITAKTFSEVLRLPEWRQGSLKVVVNVTDVNSDELNDTSSLSELTTRLINENINLAAWGKSANKTQWENLIHSNNNNGIFINNTNYMTSINQTATYIKSLIDELKPDDEYVILGDPLSIQIDPPDVMNNTADSNYPYGKWKVTHDYQYYENHIGQFSESGKYIDDFINMFDKTGRYQISYEDKPVDPENIYVHRRPTAEISIRRSGNSVTLSSNSYDLDSYSKGNKGISQEEWKYKKTTATSWTSGKLTTITGTDDYIVQLRVKDYQNTWSNPVSIYITNSANALPVASFSLQNDTITLYEDLEIIDSSYDPAGGTITNRSWEVYKGENRIYSGSNPPTSYRSYGTGDYSIYLTVTNNRGKVSEKFGRTFTVIEDEIAPEVVITPTESNWAQSVTVHLQFTDQGGSNFKNYQYAITNNQSAPSSWSSNIAQASDDIVINQEGLKYLHVRARDNAGNLSDDRVAGLYRIDRSNPVISYTGDLSSIHIDSLTLQIQATDTWSGVQSLTVNGQSIQNGNYTITKNGTYTIVATDKVGLTDTETIKVSNIYYECDAGLEHPNYSSDYDKCPICASYVGLTITKESHVYNSKEQGLEYENPKNAQIVEYYDGATTKPEKVKDYAYELKVVYEGEEYKTPFTGTYQITEKQLEIVDIVAQGKTYNGNPNIILSAGRLIGVCKEDEVRFVLPYFGTAESKNVGTWKVAIGTITLEGQDAQNYILKQPDDGTYTATITQKLLRISGLEGKNRIYNGSTTVDIIGGEVVGLIENDDVTFIIPKQGQAQSANVGRWNVTIEEILLEGQDVPNYQFIQPSKKEITVVISKEIGNLVIGCDSKKYDREVVVPYIVEKNSTSEVEYYFYKSGTNEQVEVPYDLGTYDVIAYMPTDGNYTENYSNKVTFEITRPAPPLIKLESQIIEMNDNPVESVVRKNESVHYQDKITIEFTVENLGEGSGYVGKFISQIPEGLEFVAEDEINKANGWEETEEGIVETKILSYQTNIENEIFSGKEEKSIQLVLQVTNFEKSSITFMNQTQIEQQDKRGDMVEYQEENQGYGKTSVGMDFKYTDFKIEKRIIEIIETNILTGQQEKYDIYQNPGEFVKLDLGERKIGNSKLNVRYEIAIKNEGNEQGEIENIIDILPKGVTFKIVDNEGWKINKEGNAQHETIGKILPNETKKVEIELEWEVTQDSLEEKQNQVILDAKCDLDQILIQETKEHISKTNNYATSSMIVSIVTGKMILLWTILSLSVLGILVTGIIAIKKIVMKT